MRYDLLLVPFGATYAQMRAATLAAEEAGFSGLWTFDHLRVPAPESDLGVPECWTVLSALAEATSRIQLGPLVLNVVNRRPGVLANMAATLQEVSGGRLLLGLGAGGGPDTPYTTEITMIGVEPESDRVRRERVAEAAQVLRLLWENAGQSFDGRYYRLHRPGGFLRPDPAPPILIGGFGRQMATVAGRHGDGFNTYASNPALPELIEIARRERRKSGRDLDRFVVSVFAGFRSSWLQQVNAERAQLEKAGVGRLILQVEPPYPLDAIRASAPALAALMAS